jgi:cytidylate kinase
MIITLSGMPGAGKSTVAALLAERLHLSRYYTGQIMRDMAKERGTDLVTYLRYLETHPEEEKEIDAKVAALRDQKDIIVESRTAFHFIPDSIKVFLDVSLDKGAMRIFEEMKKQNNRNEISYSSAQEAYANQKGRLELDRQRYLKLYGFDLLDRNNYDLVIDTTDLAPQQVADKIIEKIAPYSPK